MLWYEALPSSRQEPRVASRATPPFCAVVRLSYELDSVLSGRLYVPLTGSRLQARASAELEVSEGFQMIWPCSHGASGSVKATRDEYERVTERESPRWSSVSLLVVMPS